MNNRISGGQQKLENGFHGQRTVILNTLFVARIKD
jgi:hypothetical protein